jgi:hypothetical protein
MQALILCLVLLTEVVVEALQTRILCLAFITITLLGCQQYPGELVSEVREVLCGQFIDLAQL